MLAETNDREGALRECAQALELSPGDPVMLYNCTCFYSLLAEVDRSIDTLHQATASGYVNFGWLKQDPDLNSPRANPKFQALLAEH